MKLPALLKKNPAPRFKGALTRAAERLKAHQSPSGEARIGFLIDATGSRSANWQEAQQIQSRMFGAVSSRANIALRLIHFGGCELTDHGWKSNTKEITKRMREVSCRSGRTQFLDAFPLFLGDEESARATSIIMIGDAFEESLETAKTMADDLASKGIRVFSFLDGNYGVAEEAFAMISDITLGKFARFGADLPLSDLCEGVALLASGGEDALRKIKNDNVKRLLLSGPDQ